MAEFLRVGWIGTGIMGTSMAVHLLEAGHTLSVYNRTKTKAEPLLEKGAAWCDSPEALAEVSEVIFLMLGYPEDVRQIVLRLLPKLRPGTIVVDMTTSSPSLEVELAECCAERQVGYLDAPVSGGDIGARNATLSIMVGGERELFDRLVPCLERMGKTLVYHGTVGSGQHAKMVNQTLIAGSMIGLCEALLYASRAGLEMQCVLASVERGAAGSWSLSNLAPRILQGDFKPGFMIEHFLKDLRIALEEADRMKIALPGLALVRQLYLAAAAQGHARDGTQALIHALARLSNAEMPPA